ncbi:MAG TPA: hypothetical protein VF041_23305 [Gemmatimonadaceae bacterium]
MLNDNPEQEPTEHPYSPRRLRDHWLPWWGAAKRDNVYHEQGRAGESFAEYGTTILAARRLSRPPASTNYLLLAEAVATLPPLQRAVLREWYVHGHGLLFERERGYRYDEDREAELAKRERMWGISKRVDRPTARRDVARALKLDRLAVDEAREDAVNAIALRLGWEPPAWCKVCGRPLEEVKRYGPTSRGLCGRRDCAAAARDTLAQNRRRRWDR